LRQFFLHGKWNGAWFAENGPRFWLEFNLELHTTETSLLWFDQIAELVAQIATRLLQMSIDAMRTMSCRQLVFRLAQRSVVKQQVSQEIRMASITS